MAADCSLFLLSVNTISIVLFAHLPHVWMHPPLAHPCSGTPKEVESTTVKNAPSPRAHIPFVFRDNLLRISQIPVAFAAPPVLPPVAHWPGKVGHFWESRRGALGYCPQSGCTLSFPHCRQIWVTKIAFFGGSTVTSSGGMQNNSDSRLPAQGCTSLRAPGLAFPLCDPAKNKALCPWSMNTSFFFPRLSLRMRSQYCGICCAVVKWLEYFLS